jgi:hypothetical protein
MNQTLQRLEMIKAAISIGDLDVVQLLQLKIALLTHDERIQQIVEALHSKNYVLAQQLIEQYLNNPPQEHLFSSPFEDEESLKETFELFETVQNEHPTHIDNTNRHLFDSISETEDEIDNDKTENRNTLHFDENETYDFTNNSVTPSQNIQEEESTIFDLPPIDEPVPHYEAIAYIEQKYINLKTQYPPVADAELTQEAQTWMQHIEKFGCTEKDIEEHIEKVLELKTNEQLAEAAQLLLVTASVPSLYAEYILARELFRGEILQENRPEAFRIMYRLAENELYGEAMCDLAQFYEYGIETQKDTKKAEALYKDAMHSGIRRAEKHYMRLHKANRGFFSFLKG